MRFRICVTGRNHRAYTEQCLRSIYAQRAPTFELRVDWTDDASEPDRRPGLSGLVDPSRVGGSGTRDFAEIFLNRHRLGGLHNFFRAIHRAKDDDVLLFMGGDDYLERPGTLAELAALYADESVWMTYGKFRNSNDQATHVFYEWDGRDLRDESHDFLWMPMTCRAWLAKKVLEEDLKVQGYWQWSSGDVALNVPIAEMAGPEHARFIDETWYVRRAHDANDGKLSPAMQYFCAWLSYARPRYSRILGRADIPRRDPHKMRYGLIFHPDGKGNNSMPQGTSYGEDAPMGETNRKIAAWVSPLVERSKACPRCKGERLCDHDVERPSARHSSIEP